MPVFKILYGSNSSLALHFQELVTVQLAKDYSSLANLIRHALYAENEEEVQEMLEQFTAPSYKGDEKRAGDRRQSVH